MINNQKRDPFLTMIVSIGVTTIIMAVLVSWARSDRTMKEYKSLTKQVTVDACECACSQKQ
tara:strand:- start:90701 stop:90883 length:183 start_codon:yes stop_codon:yes gene_type:complete